MSIPILTTDITSEYDIVLARQRARQIAGLLGFDAQDQTRLATAVSEIARNAYQYASGGKVAFELEATPPTLLITVRDRGPGIARLADVLDGRYRSPTGMGLGILGARRLSDRFDIRSDAERHHRGAGEIPARSRPRPSRARPPRDWGATSRWRRCPTPSPRSGRRTRSCCARWTRARSGRSRSSG